MTGSLTPQVVILERAHSFANEAVFTVALQYRRLRSVEPEDTDFVFRWWADMQFLIVALRRLRRAAEMAKCVPSVSAAVESAIRDFDQALPGLSVMRNVGEHIDDYVVGGSKRRQKSVERGDLQVGTWNGTIYSWLGQELNVDQALRAAESLYAAVREATR